MHYELLIRNATFIDADGERPAHNLAALDGAIVEIAPEIPGSAETEIDADGLLVLPGLIDPHVHFNEPGRTEWEGIATGSAALAAGGGTCFFDMPLNSSPPLLDTAAFDAKLSAAQAKSHVDFGFWGGLTPLNVARMDELAERGVVGFKAFMCDSGIDEFPRCDDDTLLEGMRTAARLGLPVAVHAESQTITSESTRRCVAAGRTGVRDFLASRPVEAECEAIERAIQLASESRCSLHIVHVSCGRGVALVTEARAKGIDVTCETCPHYLFLTDEDMLRIGAAAKCAPPLRSRVDQAELWARLEAGDIAFVASDHSPAPPEMKASPDFFRVWGGIAGCQTTLALLLGTSVARGRRYAQIARLASTGAAKRFGLDRKGWLRTGMDADLILVDPTGAIPLRSTHLLYRHPISPYLGRPIHGIIKRTILRGATVFDGERVIGPPRGRLVVPRRT